MPKTKKSSEFRHLKKWAGDETGIDSISNYAGETRYDWYVSCGRHRDSDVLTNCNFQVALKELGGEQDGKVEVFNTGHWAVGWTEVILIHESAKDLLTIAEDIGDRLEQYPVLDEDAFSEAEDNEREENWDSWARRDLERELARYFEKVFAVKDGDQYLEAVKAHINVSFREWTDWEGKPSIWEDTFESLTNRAYHNACMDSGEATCLTVDKLEHNLEGDQAREEGAAELVRLLHEEVADFEQEGYRLACEAYNRKYQLTFPFYNDL